MRGSVSLILFLNTCGWLRGTWGDSGTDKQITQPDYTIYHRMEDARDRIKWLVDRNHGTFRVDELKAGDRNYSTTMEVVTVDLSGNSIDEANKIRLLLNYGEHGRELVTVEVALKLLEILSDPSAIEAYTLKRKGNPEKILHLLEHCIFKIIPMENPHGRNLVEAGNLCERKNGRGVDSNRNWPVDWGTKEADYDPYEEYPGTKPFSEPEVQILDQLSKEFKPHIWVNVHSGMKALFMPYDHMASLPNDENGKLSLNLLQQLNALKCEGQCVVGSGGKSVGYLAHGTGTDYMHDVLGVPLSFTWEIYGDEQATFQECFKMFNPLTKEHLDQEVNNWADAILAMIELLPSDIGAGSNSDPGLSHRKFLPSISTVNLEGLVFNHSETDIASGIRKSRMEDILAIVSATNELLGLHPQAQSWGSQQSTILLYSAAFLAFCGVSFFGIRKYSRRKKSKLFGLEKSRDVSRTL